MSRLRLGVMGGTFDPIHNGHLVAASEVAAAFNLDEVLFVPTGEPWQKSEVTPTSDRYLMAEIATAANPRFKVSTVDIDRDGPTYTVDTLRDLRAQHPDADLFFITGADAVTSIAGWKDSADLWSLAKFVAVTRPGHVLDLPEAPAGAIQVLEIPALAISSTDIRSRVLGGKPIWYLVPDGIVQFIAKHGLYSKRSIEEVETLDGGVN
jgi:nicotinate-nucleotide adenylyltransferase